MEELNNFVKEYEKATNSHIFSNVEPLINKEAIYWFSNGSHHDGIANIKKAFEKTFEKIQNETYSINNVNWLSVTDQLAACVYDFHWVGEIDGKQVSGNGRGTNVMAKANGHWQMLHEHLSKKQ